MTLAHELGHVVTGVFGGGELVQLELRPWHLPHSHRISDPHPLITLWGGPILGCLAPLSFASLIRWPATWYVAWFCVVANASYLLLGCFSGATELDSNQMIAAGNAPLTIILTSAIALACGYAGFRKSCIDLLSGTTPPRTRRTQRISFTVLLTVIILQAVIGTVWLHW